MHERYHQCCNISSVAEEEERHKRIFGQLLFAKEEDQDGNATKDQQAYDLW
jgi:hypothetical protein